MTWMIAQVIAGLDWTGVGVIGGTLYTVYQVVSNGQIKTAILELKGALERDLATLRQNVAVNYEKHASLAGTVKELQDQVLQLHKDIAYRDGLLAQGGDPKST